MAVEELVRAAREYIARGWVPIALGPDADGRPKKPLAMGWPSLTLTDPAMYRQGWKNAIGVGVSLGPNSGNLAVVDIDDQELAATVFAQLARSHSRFRWVWTIRNRGHLYLREKEPSAPKTMTVEYKGRPVKIELKAKGQQVAAPSTPGYVLAREEEPTECTNIWGVWERMAHDFGIVIPSASAAANYPAPWSDRVNDGERNNSLFIECCRLAAARMPMEQCLSIMLARISLSYNGHLNEREVRATVHSAYRKAWAKTRALTEEFADELVV